MTKTGQLIVTVKQFVRYRFAWPGGYEVHAVTSDGDVLCHACTQAHLGQIVASMVAQSHDGWQVVGTDINYEDSSLFCDHCDKQLKPAYEAQ